MVDFNAIVNAHAASQLRATETVTPKKPIDLTCDQWTYKGWQISFDMPPIPIRSFDWSATGPNYDASYEGPEDGWVATGGQVHAATYEELLVEIELAIDEASDDQH